MRLMRRVAENKCEGGSDEKNSQFQSCQKILTLSKTRLESLYNLFFYMGPGCDIFISSCDVNKEKKIWNA